MTQPAKFLFGERFGEPVADNDHIDGDEQRLQAQFEIQLMQAREIALQEGRDQERQSMMQSLDAKTSQTLEMVIERASESSKQIDAYRNEIRAEALRFAVMAADKLAAGLLQKDPTAVLEQLFDECFELVNKAPHVAIRVSDTLAEKIKTRVEEAAIKKGFEGEILVIPDPEIEPGDGRLEWADGGASRSYAEIRGHIDNAVARYLEVLGTSQTRPREFDLSQAQVSPDAETENGRMRTHELGEMA